MIVNGEDQPLLKNWHVYQKVIIPYPKDLNADESSFAGFEEEIEPDSREAE